AELVGKLADAVPVVADHPVVHRRLIERRQILALKVLDDGDLERSLVVDVLDERRDRFESGLPGGTPAALPGDQLERAGSQRTDQDRLKDAVLPDARRELGNR